MGSTLSPSSGEQYRTPAAGRLVTEPLAADENSKVSKTRQVIQQLGNGSLTRYDVCLSALTYSKGRWKVYCWLKQSSIRRPTLAP